MRITGDRVASGAIVLISLQVLWQTYLWAAYPSGGKSTCILALILVERLIYPPDGVHYAMAFAAAGTLMALAGATVRAGRRWTVAMFAPQFLVLAAMSVGGIVAAAEGRYLDKTPMEWPHISSDQAAYVTLTAIQFLAMVARCKSLDG